MIRSSHSIHTTSKQDAFQIHRAVEAVFSHFCMPLPVRVLQGSHPVWEVLALHRPLGLIGKKTSLPRAWGVRELLSFPCVHP